jgi:hypothetical protein
MALAVEVPLMRKEAINLINNLGKTHYIAQPKDLAWWTEDLHKIVDTKVAWVFVENHREKLESQYPLEVTNWFLDFYNYLCFFLVPKYNIKDRYIDWNLFFTLARPIEIHPSTSFNKTIQKLQIAQGRDLRAKLKEECYQDVELRTRVLKGELVPPKYTEDINYIELRHYIERRIQQDYKGVAKQLKASLKEAENV